MRIILLGPPGSGKGTQGDLIAQKLGFPKISTGDLLREAVRKGTSLGKKAEATMNRGDLVSDELVLQMVAERIAKEDCQKGYVLDGFPRNLEQARMLESLSSRPPEIILDFRVNEERLIERLSSRRICTQCGLIYNNLVKLPDRSGLCDACGGELVQRKDDDPDVIRERLKVYCEETEPLVAYYKKKKNYHKIDGDKDIESVFREVRAVLAEELERFDRTEAIR